MSHMSIVEGPPHALPAQRMRVLADAHAEAGRVLPRALVHLETLMRLYYLRHSFDYLDPHLVQIFTTIVQHIMLTGVGGRGKGAMFRRAQGGAHGGMPLDPFDAEDHARATLALCFKGLSDQGQRYYFASVICRFLLSRQAPQDITLITPYLNATMIAGDDDAPAINSEYPLYMGREDDPDDTRLVYIAGDQPIH